jgi:hypothetical protein
MSAYLVLSVNGITSANAASGRARSSARTIVAPISTTLSAISQHFPISNVAEKSIPIGAISSHVTCISTDATDDVGREVALFRAVVFSVTNLTTVLASLILIVSKSTIECCKLTKLVTLELILTFWDRGSLRILELWFESLQRKTYSLNNVVDQLLRLVNLLLGICHD